MCVCIYIYIHTYICGSFHGGSPTIMQLKWIFPQQKRSIFWDIPMTMEAKKNGIFDGGLPEARRNAQRSPPGFSPLLGFYTWPQYYMSWDIPTLRLYMYVCDYICDSMCISIVIWVVLVLSFWDLTSHMSYPSTHRLGCARRDCRLWLAPKASWASSCWNEGGMV